MFNLIMGGTPGFYDHWLFFKQNSGVFHFPLSRVFEGTPERIRKKITPLNSAAYSYIESLPTLFMSELYIDDDGLPYVDIRLGKISNISALDKDLNFNFEIFEKYPHNRIINKRNIEMQLELDTYGLNRTHWAIKDKHLNEVLQLFGVTSSGTHTPLTLSLPEERDLSTSIDSLKAFIDKVLTPPLDEGEDIFYRGHSDYSYEIAPSLFRRNDNGNFKYLHAEASLVREALSARPSEFIEDRTMLDKLVRMQHYGLPTRLLDITSNPLMALYFACSNTKNDKNGKEIDGQVIIFKTHRNKIKFFDSDTVSCISNLSMLTQELKNDLDCNMNKDIFNTSNACLKLIHHIKDEKPYFKNEIIPADLEKIIFVKSRVNNERISSQSGAFLLFGNNAVFPDIMEDTLTTSPHSFKIERITIKNKKQILKELATLNITDATVYQGLERTMKLIANKYASDL